MAEFEFEERESAGGATSMARTRAARWLALAVVTAMLLAAVAWPGDARAAHESTNTLVFAPVDGSPVPAASGQGVIDFRGGVDLESRWTVQLEFRGLAPGTTYVAALQGYLGEPDTPEAAAFTELCVVRASPTGDGWCWWYLLGMRRVDVVQLRIDSVDGPPVLQATRRDGGPGSITSVPNEFSPAESTPVASPAVASPAMGSPAVASPVVASPVALGSASEMEAHRAR